MAFIAVISIIMLIIGAAQRVPVEFPLPDTSVQGSAPPESVTDNGSGPARIAVTTSNVQRVIATLSRPAYYSRDIMIENFWADGNAVYNLSSAVSDGSFSLRRTAGGITRNIVISGGKLYIWYTGDREPYIGEVADMRSAADEFAMLLTYEDVVALDPTAISDAGYADYNGDDCVYVTFTSGEFGYSTTCYVSVSLGLLVGAVSYDGEEQIYKMTTGECNLAVPDAALFVPPNG